MTAILRAIYLRPERGSTTIQVNSVLAKPGIGLDGDHNKKGSRQVTLLTTQAWKEVCDELKIQLDPSIRRANLLIDGLDFQNCLNRVIKIGTVTIRIVGETKPCRLMDEACPGLKNALAKSWRGGVFGEILSSGNLITGNSVTWSSEL